MPKALIGHSGFVGETLKRQASFDSLFRSSDIALIDGREFDLVVCAGATAAKWKANQEPEADRANVHRLMEHLARLRARRFILVSTVDVYPRPKDVDEGSPIVPDPTNAYGTNRLELEKFCQNRFDALVVRLPALFGQGLRKNAVYDLLHDNCIHQLQPLSTYQLFDMALLWEDLQKIEVSGLKTVNLATEPLSLADIARIAFGRILPENPRTPVARYDSRTRHGLLWGRADGYAYGADETVARLSAFVAAERARGLQ
jgi:nucleoside-diphosphate-sugar epimerase